MVSWSKIGTITTWTYEETEQGQELAIQFLHPALPPNKWMTQFYSLVYFAAYPPLSSTSLIQRFSWLSFEFIQWIKSYKPQLQS